MSRILALLLGTAGLLVGTSLPDLPLLGRTHAVPAVESTRTSAKGASSSDEAVSGNRTEALPINIVDLPASAADRVVYVAGDVGIAIRGTDVSAHVDGRPTLRVHRIGNGLRVYKQSVLVTEVALRSAPNGIAVDWIWAPQPYYAVTFPSLGVRVTGMRSDPGEESMDALRVTHVDPGSSAEASGLTAGSRIDAIIFPTSSAYESSEYESFGEVPATPLALRHALDQARRGSSRLRLRVQHPETQHERRTEGVISLSPGRAPIQ